MIEAVGICGYGYINIALYIAVKKKDKKKNEAWKLMLFVDVILTIGMFFLIHNIEAGALTILGVIEMLFTILLVVPSVWKQDKKSNNKRSE